MLVQSQIDKAANGIQGGRLMRLLRRPLHLLQSKRYEVAARRSGVPIEVEGKTFWGQPFHAVIPELVSMSIYRYGIFEVELTRTFVHLLKPGMKFFDVGSHFGYFSLLASEAVGPTGQVHAFDPTPSTFAMLTKNTQSRGNVIRNNVAAGASPGTATFNDFGVVNSAYNSLNMKQSKLEPGAAASEIQVQVVTLDDYCERTGAWPDVMKVDAEGAELSILQGCPKLLARRSCSISLELGDVGATKASGQSRRVVDHMLAHNYRPMEWSGEKLVPHTPLEQYPYCNILFVPG